MTEAADVVERRIDAAIRKLSHSLDNVFRPVVDGKCSQRSHQFVVLSWEPAGELAKDEWYAVRISWAENGTLSQRGGNNLKETSWQIPADFYWGKADHESGRAYEWYVYVERVTEADDGEKVGEPVSSFSETRVLYWR